MRYLIIIERSETGYAAYCPDLDGCVATGASIAEVEETMREAVELHIDGLKETGEDVPVPQAHVTYVEVAA